MEPVKVLIVDDHALFRCGVTSVLANQESIRVVGEAADGMEALDKAREAVPDVILMDLNMPRCSGLEAIQALQVEMPQVGIIVFTVSEMETDLFATMKFGARGYILKNTQPEELIHAILYISQGGVIVSPLMATKLLAEFTELSARPKKEPVQEADDNLSPREGEVLQQVAQGATNKQIADSLFISENTVKTHLRNIMEKLHISNRSQAVAYAVERGLTKPRE